MVVYILFGQRKESYEGQHAPEALSVMDEYSYDENPNYMTAQKEEADKSDEFVSTDIFQVDLGDGAVDALRKHLLEFPRLANATSLNPLTADDRRSH